MAGLRSRIAVAVLTMVSSPIWAQNYLTGANTGATSTLDNLPTIVTYSLTVTGSGTYALAGGIFYMKDGPQTTDDVTLTVYNSLSAPIGSVTLSNSDFCGGPNTPACQSYFYHTFTLPSPLLLSAGSYRLVLSSQTPPQSSRSYFVVGVGVPFNVVIPPVPPPPAPDLTVSKGASPSNFTGGASATYGIQVANIGNLATSGVITVSDTLDPNLTFVSVQGTNWSCSAAGGIVTCTTNAAIAAGDTAPPITLIVNVAANGETSVTNTVSISGGGETNTSNDFFQLLSPVSAPDLVVAKTATPATFTAGQKGVVYTVTAGNVGSAPSSGGITVTDTLDSNLTFVSASGSGWTCSASGQVVTCNTSAVIGAGATAPPITITANVSATAPATVTNTIAIAGGGGVNPSNNSFQLVSNVVAPDLTVSKSLNSGALSRGQVGAVYTVTASNIGSGATSGLITVTDTLDSNLVYVSAAGSGWSCSAAGQVVTCTTSAVIAAGSSAPPISITVNASLSGSNPTSVTNKVTVAGGGETNTSNDSFQLISAVSAPDLTVSKTATPSSFVQGQNGAHYTITANNVGSAPSAGTITVADTLDSNLTYVSATGSGWSCSASGQLVTCTTGSAIAAAASAPPITITVNVAARGETSVTNAVSVAGGGDVDPANNSFQLVSSVVAPNLSVSKIATPATFTPGQNGVIYTITAINVGNASSSGSITVTDTLDPNLTYVSATGSGWTCSASGQTVTCTTSASIASGTSAPSITLTVNVTANPGPTVTNTVSIAGGGDVDPSNNASQVVSDVIAPDLTVSKTSGAFKSAQVGAAYTVTVSNIGSGPSVGLITVTDTLDPNLAYVSAAGSGWNCSAAGQVVTCTTSAAIAAGASGPPISIAVNVTVSGSTATSVTNRITVAGGGETNTSNDSFQLVSVVNAPDLIVSKTATPTLFIQGQKGALYTITASNIGSAPSSSTITVTDTLDPNLNFVSATGAGWNCSAAGQVVSCTTGTVIAAGASAPPITLTVNVGIGEDSVTNSVSISGGAGANPTNNSFKLVTPVGSPSLSVSKTATPATFNPGQNGVVYTITLTNSGNAPSSGLITVTDTLDPSLTYVKAAGSVWSCSASGQVVTCTTSAIILAEASTPITLTANVAASAPALVLNTVTVSGGGDVNLSKPPFQLQTPVSGGGSAPPAQSVPAVTTPVLIAAGMMLIGIVVWLRRRAMYE